MQTATTVIRPILLSTLLGLSGCFSLSRNAPPQLHYVLGADRQSEATEPVGGPPGVMIGLRPPRLAEYLATPFIVVRGGPHRIRFSEFARWGEDLARGVDRALAGHMALRAPSRRVQSVPWPVGARPDYLIQLHLLRFEGVAPADPESSDGEAHVLATWEILGRDGALLARGTTEVRERGWTVGDFDALVGLLDAGLGTLAEDLVLGLDRALLATASAGAEPRAPTRASPRPSARED